MPDTIADRANASSSAEAAFEQMAAELARLVLEVRDLNTRLPDITASVRMFESNAADIKLGVAAVAAAPAIKTTPAEHMKAGSVAAISSMSAHVTALQVIANELRGIIGHVRIRDEQFLAIVGSAAITAVLCAFVFLALPRWINGPRPNTLAEMTADEQWAASAQFGAAASPLAWSRMARSHNLGLADGELAAIELCNASAAKLSPAQKCTVVVVAPKK